MLSSTYQMSSRYDAQAARADPENRLHWRAERRRLEAEEIRDALAATYRGARESERRRLAEIGAMEVTLSYDLLVFRPR
jgi:hypothetical protein